MTDSKRNLIKIDNKEKDCPAELPRTTTVQAVARSALDWHIFSQTQQKSNYIQAELSFSNAVGEIDNGKKHIRRYLLLF